MTHMDTVPQSLRAFFDAHPRLALAFSGGVDSAYLLYAARACGCDVAPFYARSAFQPEFERQDALRLAAQLDVALNEVPLDVLAVEAVRRNPDNRCYHCKQAIFTALLAAALAALEILKAEPETAANKEQLQKVATPEAFVDKMRYEPHETGDVLLITGVGKVYPFMRSHKILDNIQHIFADIPVLMLYPGTFNGQDLGLFGKFLDGHYYRAFNLL